VPSRVCRFGGSIGRLAGLGSGLPESLAMQSELFAGSIRGEVSVWVRMVRLERWQCRYRQSIGRGGQDIRDGFW
jgi:hypothetical protein